MSLHLSAGTLDTMAGIFSPAKKYRLGGGGGSKNSTKSGGTMLGLAVASMFPKPAGQPAGGRPNRVKQAFGGGSQAVVSGRAIATIDRTARRVPEVLMRITGRQHGAGHVLANFAYISRLGHGADQELGLHTSEGEVIRDGRDMQDLAQDWQEWEMGDDARRKGATSLSMILSMPSGTDPERLKAAALDFAAEQFANRSWVASLHVDRDHPHVHLTFARRDHDGRRFHPTRDDLFRYRQRFAQKLRDRGIEANATPARARGVDPQHEPIAARKVRAKGGISQLDNGRIARSQRAVEGEGKDPVRIILADRQAVVRSAYAQSIAELSATASSVNQTVAKSLRRFIDGLPDPEPNSLRAARGLSKEGAMDERSFAPGTRSSHAVTDPVAAAIARSNAMRVRIEARRMAERSEPAGVRETAVTRSGEERVRSKDSAVDRPQTTGALDSVDEVMRQIRDRERARMARERERDRSPDRGGPTR